VKPTTARTSTLHSLALLVTCFLYATSALAASVSSLEPGRNDPQTDRELYTAINTPFSARAVDVSSDGRLYAVDWDGVVWSTMDRGSEWAVELDTNLTHGQTRYCSIVVASNDDVYVAVGATGIWLKNSTGWHQTFNNSVNWGVWHFAENPLTGDLYLQTHDKIIYNSTDRGNSWQVMYDMAAQDIPPVDDHFHTIAFDNATQTLWAAGGDTIDIIRRWNARSGWEIVAQGIPGNKGQPTSIMFDDDFAYFGPDAQPYVFRLNKTIRTPAAEGDFEAVLTLDSAVWPDDQWSWECRKIGPVYYLATCYNDGVMYVSVDGIHWVSVFEQDGYYLDGLGEPADPSATTKGGIPSLSSKLPVYFVCNTKIYLLDIEDTDVKMMWSQQFLSYTSERINWVCPVDNGINYIYLGEARTHTTRDVKLTLTGLTVYENIQNRTFEPDYEGGWIESGYGTMAITDEDSNSGSRCLKNIIPAGDRYASNVYPPGARSWQIQSKGKGQYFWSVWLKTNVTWSGPQLKFYLVIAYRENLTIHCHPLRINITTTWTQFAHSIIVPDTADRIACWISVYRESETPRVIYVDDAMFWGPVKTSIVSKSYQRFLPADLTNSWSIDACEYNTGKATITIKGKTYSCRGQLSNGSSSTTWHLGRRNLLCSVLEFNAFMLGPPGFSGQCLMSLEVRQRTVAWFPYRFLQPR